jgi:hypothetical protein
MQSDKKEPRALSPQDLDDESTRVIFMCALLQLNVVQRCPMFLVLHSRDRKMLTRARPTDHPHHRNQPLLKQLDLL